MLLTTPLAYGPPDRCCPGVTSLENSRSTVELQAEGRRATRLKISCPSRILDGRACGGLALRSGRPTLPGWVSPPDLLSFQPDYQTRRAPTRRSFLAQGPGRSRWRPESLDHAHRPSRVGGYNKKTPASFRARGFQFFVASTSFDHRPRARMFDGSIPGGLVARRRGIRTREQRPGLLTENLSRHWPLISDAGY